MASEPANVTEQIVDLEVRIAFQDRTLTALDEVVRQLFARVEQVEKELGDIRAAAASAAPVIGPANEPPPHY